MKWSLQELKNFYRKPLNFEEQADASGVLEKDPEIRSISPVHVKGHADVNQQKATFYMTIEGKMVLPCANTLADVEFPFSVKTTEIFMLNPDYPAVGDEDNLHKVDGHYVDLIPIIEEHILLEKPLKITAVGVDEGPAPTTGKGWQRITEEDRNNRVDPRLAGLAKFFDQNENK
ncbi:YceD family protein [Fictibacillus iocasae]|uniref:YceD family protein n=1 Tax=Fictibacillus iocasae TaxID=2715437 RepID=A0ABW2NRX2_9BACL